MLMIIKGNYVKFKGELRNLGWFLSLLSVKSVFLVSLGRVVVF